MCFQIRSPVHIKAATFDAIGSSFTDGLPKNDRPHSLVSSLHVHSSVGGWDRVGRGREEGKGGGGGEGGEGGESEGGGEGEGGGGGGGGKPVPIPSHSSKEVAKESVKLSVSPGQAQDSSALSATATDAKQITSTPREPPLFTSDLRTRKASEPPPSLSALFDHDMASSRRVMKQKSMNEAHLKQSSFDSSHLQRIESSPKHVRRIRSPTMSENTSVTSGQLKENFGGMYRAPSHPHLNSTTNSPQLLHMSSLPPAGQPLVKAHSIQQLRAESDGEDPVSIRRSNSASGKAGVGGVLLRKKKSKSKESLMREGTSLRKTPSKELVKEAGEGGKREDGSGVSVGKERTAPSRDTQTSAAISVEPTQAPLVGNQHSSQTKHYTETRRRNSSQPWGRKEVEGLYSSKCTRPMSMIETSSFRRGGQYSFDFNPAPPNLLAQLFWTAVSLLESDFEGEFTMALRLLSKVQARLVSLCGTRMFTYLYQHCGSPPSPPNYLSIFPPHQVLDRLDLSLNNAFDCLEMLLSKLKWPHFPGVQALLLKGLTLEATSEPTRTLLSHITLFASRYTMSSVPLFPSLPLPSLPPFLPPSLVHCYQSVQ